MISWAGLKQKPFFHLLEVYPKSEIKAVFFPSVGFKAPYPEEYCCGTGFAKNTEQLLNKQILKLKVHCNEIIWNRVRWISQVNDSTHFKQHTQV